MKISDFVSAKVNFENLKQKGKSSNIPDQLKNHESKIIEEDSFVKEKNITQESFKMNELQKNYLKDMVSLQGLNELQKRMELFEKQEWNDKNVNQLSKDLYQIVNSTKYEGENVISYLSTMVNDEKSLYTFKINLNSELEKVQLKISEDKKKISSFLVRNENISVIQGFSPDKMVSEVLSSLNSKNPENIYTKINHIGKLLNFEKL